MSFSNKGYKGGSRQSASAYKKNARIDPRTGQPYMYVCLKDKKGSGWKKGYLDVGNDTFKIEMGPNPDMTDDDGSPCTMVRVTKMIPQKKVTF